MVEWKGWRILDFWKIRQNACISAITSTIRVDGVEHLDRTGFDHAPMLCLFDTQAQNVIKPFRFLNFCTEHADFLDEVRQN